MTSYEMIKKVLYIANNPNGQNLKFLENYFKVKIDLISSSKLISTNFQDIIKLIMDYDIIILGGGPQHLTKEHIHLYPEIGNQIKIIKCIVNTSKILIGICLGCQIIGLAFGYQVVQMKQLCVGYNFMDLNSIDNVYISQSNDLYLSKLNYNLLAKSFSFHYDQVFIEHDNDKGSKQNNNELIVIAWSKTKVPYIIKHSKSNIYGFQFHPETTQESIKCISNNFTNNLPNNLPDNLPNNLPDNLPDNLDPNILLHFFKVFFTN
jgi:anthranilate/para-aminobenzoate synthase component II